MTELEKVMSWLEGLAQDDWHSFHSDSEVSNIAKAALTLLKEQEPISPSCDMDGRYLVCGNCGKKIGKSTNYCTKCGRAVKWE